MKKWKSTDCLKWITEETVNFKELYKYFVNIIIKPYNRIELWGELECFEDDVTDWNVIDTTEKIFHDKVIEHEGMEVTLSLYENKHERKEYEKHD